MAMSSARHLEREVDDVISAAIRVGRGGTVDLETRHHVRRFDVDRLIVDEDGHVCEVWLSGESECGFFVRLLDRLRGIRRRDILRLSQDGGSVRRCMTTIEIAPTGVLHIGFREDLAAPRISRTVLTLRRPASDAGRWLEAYASAS